MAKPKIVTIIVNYKLAELITSHLQALASEVRQFPNSSIVIIDNASPGDDVDYLRGFVQENQLSDCVEIIANPDNSGFGTGNNIAMRSVLEQAKSSGAPAPDYFFLLNPDAWVQPGAIKTLTDFLEKTKNAVIAGPRLEGEDGTIQRSNFRFFTVLGEFEQTVRTGIFTKILKSRSVLAPQGDEIVKAQWVSGAAFMMRVSMLEKSGMFDEDYFLYYEETDLMLQMQRKGLDVYYVPDARVVHLAGQSTGVVDNTGEDDVPPIFWFESRAHYFRKNCGPILSFCADLSWLSGSVLYLIRLMIFGGKKASAERAALRKTIAMFCKNQFGGGLKKD